LLLHEEGREKKIGKKIGRVPLKGSWRKDRYDGRPGFYTRMSDLKIIVRSHGR